MHNNSPPSYGYQMQGISVLWFLLNFPQNYYIKKTRRYMMLVSYTSELSKPQFLHSVIPDKTGERGDQIVFVLTT